ncbi:MAG: hypothetical protein HYR72_19825 [Deltaproteobacteria bacterium]|nr:hypothetical protein [Deltaproteobacteria bacterium]MBI3387353.1 hypothetical protein [Deltaproteobacteria bacterium]
MSLWSIDTTDAVVVATYHNPPMNYFCADGTRELSELIEAWSDPIVRAVVLTGGMPGKFITHYSVEELHALASNREALRGIGTALTGGYHAMLQRLRDLPKPVIVAMNGDTKGWRLRTLSRLRHSHRAARRSPLRSARDEVGYSPRRERDATLGAPHRRRPRNRIRPTRSHCHTRRGAWSRTGARSRR